MAEGRSGIIAGTTGAAAVRAGLEALNQGGTAMDAVLTHALADIVLLAQTVVGHAGIMTLTYYDAGSRTVHTLNAGWNTVRGETDPLSIPANTPSGRAVLVPGFMAGAEAAHRKFGKLPWATLFGPALYFAEEGVTYTAANAGLVAAKKARLEQMPASKAVFTRADGTWYQAGDRFWQPALATTLRNVAASGARYMYGGAWGRKLVEAVRAAGGRMTIEDLEAYQPTWSEPIRTRFRQYEVVGLPPPNYGGVNLLEALNLVEVADLRGAGHYTTSAESLDRLLGIARVGDLLGTSIIAMLVGGPDSVRLGRYAGGLDLSFRSRTTKAHAQALWDRMQAPGWREFDRSLFAPAAAPGTGHSDAVVAADPQGNVAALLHTSNSTTWGLLGLLIDGVGISDVGRYQQRLIAQAGPGTRLPDPTNPVIVLERGRPVLASSSIGVGLHEQTLQSIVNVLEYGMDPKSAADTAQFFRPVGPSATPSRDPAGQVIAEGKFSAGLLDAVRALGRPIVVVPAAQTGSSVGAWVGITLDPATGLRRAALQGVSNGWALSH
jgi:gamma-glutamyltranspeptidase/glutathione hydrolase